MYNKPSTLFTVEKANSLAAINNDADDDWTYVVVKLKNEQTGQEYAIIEIYDEDKVKIGTF